MNFETAFAHYREGAADAEETVLAAVLLLQFLADHPKLARPVSTTDRYPQMLESVRQDGLQFTGVWVQGAPSDLLVLAEDDCVWSIYNYHAQVRLSTDD